MTNQLRWTSSFTMIPDAVIHAGLPADAGWLYIILASLMDKDIDIVHVSIAQLANTAQMPPNTIRKYIVMLGERGFIKIHMSYTNDDGQGYAYSMEEVR